MPTFNLPQQFSTFCSQASSCRKISTNFVIKFAWKEIYLRISNSIETNLENLQNFILKSSFPRFFFFFFLSPFSSSWKRNYKIETRGLEIELFEMFFIVRSGGAFVILISRDRRPPRWLYTSAKRWWGGGWGWSSEKKDESRVEGRRINCIGALLLDERSRWVSLKDAFSHCGSDLRARNHRINSTLASIHPFLPPLSIRALLDPFSIEKRITVITIEWVDA